MRRKSKFRMGFKFFKLTPEQTFLKKILERNKKRIWKENIDRNR